MSRTKTLQYSKISRNASDFSNRVVLLLLVLVIVVSIISVIIYVQMLNRVQPKFIVKEGNAVGEVAITILPPLDRVESTTPEMTAGK